MKAGLTAVWLPVSCNGFSQETRNSSAKQTDGKETATDKRKWFRKAEEAVMLLMVSFSDETGGAE